MEKNKAILILQDRKKKKKDKYILLAGYVLAL